MRAAPAIQVLVTRFGVWRAAIWLAGGCAATVAFAWSAGYLLTRGWPEAAPAIVAGFCVAAIALMLAARVARSRAFDLRWDGRAWHLGRPDAPATDPIVGDLQVAVDLGAWLLLRFESTWPPDEPSRYWLPLQRRGLEASWHGLRCALYSPRPVAAAAPDAAQ